LCLFLKLKLLIKIAIIADLQLLGAPAYSWKYMPWQTRVWTSRQSISIAKSTYVLLKVQDGVWTAVHKYSRPDQKKFANHRDSLGCLAVWARTCLHVVVVVDNDAEKKPNASHCRAGLLALLCTV
jgi:hypothetical protein